MENKQTPMEMTKKTTHSCDMKSRLISVMHSAQRLLSLLCGIFMLTAAVAQVPQAFHYQMVVRDANDHLVRNTTVGLHLTIYTIHNGQSTNHYQERQTVTTDGNGLLSIMVGQGTDQEGVFADIPWGDYDSVFLRAQADPAGGTNYTLSAVQQLVAVPYAFLANETQGLGDVSARGNSAGNHQLKSVKDPTDPQDVITKYYLDSVLADFVKHMYSESRDTAACITPGSTLHWRGRELATAGTYRHNVPGGAADTVVILTLTVSNGTHNAFEASACNTYTWHETSYTTAGAHTYAYTDDNGCPSVDTLHLTLITGLTGDTTAEKCETFTWYGTPYTASVTPTHTFTSSQGCDSVVTLHLTINHAASTDTIATACETFTWYGVPYTASTTTPTHTFKTIHDCDSTVTLNLTINQPSAGTDTRTACDSLKWIDNQWYKSSTTATHTIPNAKGCDSTVTLNLTINPSKTTNDALTICATALPYEWNGETFTAAGSQSATLKTTKDCDSTVSMTLTVNDKYEVDDAKSICSDELPYTWNGKTFDAAGSQSVDLTAVNGCDSTVNMTLTVNSTASTDTIAIACETFTWYGETLTASTATPTHTFKTIHDCDSTVTLNLTINQPTAGTDTRTACDTYTWIDGNDYTASTTTATHTIPNAKGCDSTVTLHLTINPSKTTNDALTVCATALPYEWNGETFTAAGSQSATLKTTKNCDSTVSMTLAVNDKYEVYDAKSICSDELPYTWNGKTFDAAGSQSVDLTAVNGCDSTVNMTLTVNSTASTDTIAIACETFTWYGDTYTASTATPTHAFKTIHDCDSTVTLNLTINPSTAGTDTHTACDSLEWIDNQWYKSSNTTAIHTIPNTKGCDSTVTLHLTINPSKTTNDALTICATALPYEWNGKTFDAAGSQSATLKTTKDCDSTVSMTLTVNDKYEVDDAKSICSDELPYTWNGKTFNAAGSQSADLTAVNGCDSTVNMTLTVNSTASTDTIATACETFTWYGDTYTASTTTPTHTFKTIHDCDSTVTLNLTINQSTAGTDTRSACDSLKWIDNQWYKSSTTTATHTIPNAKGCDSTVTLHLTINYKTTGTDIQNITGDSYEWIDGNTYTEDNNTATYTITNGNANGCDSIVTLNLTFSTCEVTYGTDIRTACDSYTWIDGNTYTSSNTTATHTLTNVNDCDSIVTLNLTIISSVTEDFSITACDSYTWPANNLTYTSVPGTAPSVTLHSAAGCDSIVTLRLTLSNSTNTTTNQTTCTGYSWHGSTYSEPGTYTWNGVNAAGCPQIEKLVLTDGNVYNVTRDTVCSNVSSLIKYDTIFTADFEDDMDDSDWGVWNMCNAGGWNFYSTCYGYGPHNGSGQLAAPDEGRQCNGGDFSNGAYRYQRMTAINLCWSAAFTLSDPANTTIEFWAQKPSYYNTVGVLRVYLVPTNNFLRPDLNGTQLVNSGGSQAIPNWYKFSFNLSSYSISAGTYRLKFVHQDNDGDHNGIDDIIIYRRRVINVNDYEPGESIENVTRTALGGGCYRVEGNITYIQPAAGTVKTVTACESYTWSTADGGNGETYTASGTYTKSFSVNGCNVTNTLLLTINQPNNQTYGCDCVTYPEACPGSSYTWTANGVNGHGTGQTYTVNGTYVGPYYLDAGGCYARDTLKLTVR